MREYQRNPNPRKTAQKLNEGDTVNRLYVIGFTTVWSELYQRPWKDGNIQVRCLDCQKVFVLWHDRVRKGNPAHSKYSCGCTRRPRKLPPVESYPRTGAGRPTLPLEDNQFGDLTVKHHIKSAGWLCECTCGATRIVKVVKWLLEGKITACKACMIRRGWQKRYGYAQELGASRQAGA